jgi:D-glycero-alpha-D-manno-heptose 1-phosphate guanylyltransferase
MMMKTTEAILLAGGFGTRLKHIVNEMPKPMAPINGIPFLSFVMEQLATAGIQHVVISTGYLHEKIESFYQHSYKNIKISYAHETEPLGTGGAIMFSLKKTSTNDILILNGDTLFKIDFKRFDSFYQKQKIMLAVALRKTDDLSRYGSVSININHKIIAFAEKNQIHKGGLINGGIYLLNKYWFEKLNTPKTFSFEKEILEKLYGENDFYGLPFDKYFIDIGIPQDYRRAQIELPLFN